MSYFAKLKRRIRIHMCKKTKSRKKSLATEGVCDRASRQKSGGEGISTHAATVEEVERASQWSRSLARSPFPVLFGAAWKINFDNGKRRLRLRQPL